MSSLLASLGAAALLAQPGEMRNPRMSPTDIAAGAKTFRSHCAGCHGLAGEGGRGPNLAAGVFYHGSSDEELLNTISNGIPGTEMPGLFYSPDRVWQIVAYIRSLNKPLGTAATGNAAKGEQIFGANKCNQCHRIRGEGGRLGPDLTNIGQVRSPAHLRQSILDPNAEVLARYWVVSFVGRNGERQSGFPRNEDTYTLQLIDFEGQLHSYSKADLKEYKVDKISKMPSYKGVLSEEELNDLVAYLASLRPQRTAQ